MGIRVHTPSHSYAKASAGIPMRSFGGFRIFITLNNATFHPVFNKLDRMAIVLSCIWKGYVCCKYRKEG